MAAKTQQFKSAGSNLGRTIGQSLSMITGKDIANYSLLFLDETLTRKRGEHETIFMPHIVLGRSSRCHVRYGDEYRTVSREHASITVDGSSFVLNHNISASNPTYVNGSTTGGSYALQNGDEIQLSSNGPKLRFNTSTLKTSTIGLTSRIGQAMSQAVKPYKTALLVMGLLLLGSLAFSGMNMYKLSEAQESYNKEIEGLIGRVDAGTLELASAIAEIEKLNNASRYKGVKKGNTKPKGPSGAGSIPDSVDDGTISAKYKDLPYEDIYYIYATKVEAAIGGELEEFEADQVWPGEKKSGLWSGTGFLTDENLFVTARHVVQPWRFPNSPWMKRLSYLEANGAILSVTFEALSSNGDNFSFTSKSTTFDDSSDKLINNEFVYEGETIKFKSKEHSKLSSDWAFIKMTSRKGKCKINRSLSQKLPTGTEIYPVGYSYSLSLQPSGSDLKPLFSKCVTAQDRLTNGVINTTMRGFGPGNSGGPVFIRNQGKFEVIGIVTAGMGSEIGIIVPVGNLW